MEKVIMEVCEFEQQRGRKRRAYFYFEVTKETEILKDPTIDFRTLFGCKVNSSGQKSTKKDCTMLLVFYLARLVNIMSHVPFCSSSSTIFVLQTWSRPFDSITSYSYYTSYFGSNTGDVILNYQ